MDCFRRIHLLADDPGWSTGWRSEYLESDNPRERFWAARTRQLHRSHVTVYDRLWSCLPYLRPLVTITGDSLSGYGVDGLGGRVHDVHAPGAIQIDQTRRNC